MTDIGDYHNWLCDTHAMERQAEVILITATRRGESYPPLRARLEQHLYEARRRLSSLQDIIARNHIFRSTLQDAMSRVAVLGQSIGTTLLGNKVIKVIITAYVFTQFEAACYATLLTTTKRVGDHHAIYVLEAMLTEKRDTADWLLHHRPTIVGQFLHCADLPGVEARK